MDEHAIDIEVEPTYLAEQSNPFEERFVFAYTITLRNSGRQPARLLTRRWLITDGNGKVEEVRGAGVVGEQPYLRPGDHFRYTSGVVLDTPVGTMEGSYRMVDDAQAQFDVSIPLFTLCVPHSLN